MNSAQQDIRERPGFKVVCRECGSLSIKMADFANAPADTRIECGRCTAFRGTLAELHVLARRGNDLFEF
jgi:ribosomal protein S27AE